MHIAPLGNRQLEWVNEEVLVLEVLLLAIWLLLVLWNIIETINSILLLI
jgi:hypothetical protein